MLRMFWGVYFCVVFVVISKSYGLQTETLPQGRATTALKFGQIAGLEQKFTDDQKLVQLKDEKSINFDAATIAKFNPRAMTLVQTLNQFGLYNAGDLFNLGTLEIEIKPEINFVAPVYAKALTSQWTLGFAVPVIQYSNKVQLTQSYSNMQYYNQFRGLSDDLDAALDTDLKQATQEALAQKGYEPISDRSSSFLGDVQLVSIYKFLEKTKSKWLYQASLNLPTGPQYNSDDLLALNSFHKFSLENSLIYSYTFLPLLTLNPFFNFKYFLPEQRTVRVPQNREDQLPDQNSKDTLTYQEGFTSELGLNSTFFITPDFTLSGEYKVGQKTKDTYSGSAKGNSTFLAENSNSLWQKVSAEVSYSTIQNYLNKKSFAPMTFSFLIYDTIAGKNIERRTGQEITASLYF